MHRRYDKIIQGEENGWVTERGMRVIRNDFSKEKNIRMYDGHDIAGHTRHHYWINKLDDKPL